MRVELKELLEKLGVDRVLSPYETQPWFHYDEGRGISCSAEIRMGPGSDDLEAEIQFLYDERDEEAENTEQDDGEQDTWSGTGPRQIMRMRATPMNDNKWTPRELFVKGENFAGKVHDWEGKSCNFFRACIEAIQMSILPEIDELIEKELDDDDGFGGGRRGRIGRKSPKVKPGQLLGMKKGM